MGNAQCVTSTGKKSTYSPTQHVSLQATPIFNTCNLTYDLLFLPLTINQILWPQDTASEVTILSKDMYKIFIRNCDIQILSQNTDMMCGVHLCGTAT